MTPKNLDKYLGVRKYSFGMAEKQNQVGQVTGLAWTEVGGELLTIEAVTMPGKGKTITTGKLGDVMQESIQAALSVVRTRSRKLGVKEDFYQKNDIHIHLPEGATPKDGPSAGIGIATAMVSVLTGIPVRADVAMTGEITLRGEVLQIGGLKEKLLAAHRGGIKTVLIPEENVKDLVEIPDNIKNKLEIVPVKWIDKVLEIALERQPEPLPEHDESAPIPPKPDDQPGAVDARPSEQGGPDRADRAGGGDLEVGRRARGRRPGRRGEVQPAQGRDGDAGRLRHLLRRQARRAHRPQPAHRRGARASRPRACPSSALVRP